MNQQCIKPPLFQPGQQVISLVEHPPEIEPGTKAKIVSSWLGTLCAVQLPDGKIHRWFAWFELQPSTQLRPGSYARVVSNIGHGNPPHVPLGTMVKIVRCMPGTMFYDALIDGTHYHRWFAEFELAADSNV